jgi:hypothetical protein
LHCQRLATDGEPEPEPEPAAAEFPADRGVCLVNWMAKRPQDRRIDAYPGTGHNQSNTVIGSLDA